MIVIAVYKIAICTVGLLHLEKNWNLELLNELFHFFGGGGGGGVCVFL